jgi:hypothetical protein
MPYFYFQYQVQLQFSSIRSWDRSADIATGYGLDCRGSILDRGKTFLFYTAFKPALGPTLPSTQWVPEFFPWG